MAASTFRARYSPGPSHTTLVDATVRRPILRRRGLQEQIGVLWQVCERETGIPLDVASADSLP